MRRYARRGRTPGLRRIAADTMATRRPTGAISVKVIGMRQMLLGFALVAATAAGARVL